MQDLHEPSENKQCQDGGVTLVELRLLAAGVDECGDEAS